MRMEVLSAIHEKWPYCKRFCEKMGCAGASKPRTTNAESGSLEAKNMPLVSRATNFLYGVIFSNVSKIQNCTVIRGRFPVLQLVVLATWLGMVRQEGRRPRMQIASLLSEFESKTEREVGYFKREVRSDFSLRITAVQGNAREIYSIIGLSKHVKCRIWKFEGQATGFSSPNFSSGVAKLFLEVSKIHNCTVVRRLFRAL
jgi:hypothetical protein